jgi:peptide chain release factor 1
MSENPIFDKLDQIEKRYEELTAQISSPEVLSDSARYQKLARTHGDQAQIVEKYREWKQIDQGLREAHQIQVESSDADMKQMAHDEEKQLAERKQPSNRI